MRFVLSICFLSVGAVATLSNSARADTIEYSTSGYFGTPGTTSISSGGETLSFTGLTDIFVNTPSTISLGNFVPMFGASGSSGSFAGDTFTLILTEIENGVSTSKSLTASLNGSLKVSSTGAPSSNVFVNFGSQTQSFVEGNGNSVTFTPYNTPVGITNTTVQGNIDAAPPVPVTPLPKSALGTAGLFGLIAVGQLARRSISRRVLAA